MKIKLPEPLPSEHWPSEVSSCDLIRIVRTIHSSPIDFDEGDLASRIHLHTRYGLKHVSIEDIDTTQWALCSDLVDEYTQMTTPAPPIVFDPQSKSIIDGTHRARAALLRGDGHIWAYCPL